MLPAASTHKYACDACRRRKIRCDKTQPCAGCTTALLSCTFLAPSLPKGRRGLTANVISELRSSQIRSIQGSISQRPSIYRAVPTPPQSVRNPDLLTLDTFNACVEFYFAQFHSSVPILEKEILLFDGNLSEIPSDLYCLVVSFCAFIILQTGAVHLPSTTPTDSLLSADIGYGQSLIQEALETRRNSGPIVLPSVQTVITSFFLYGCFRFLNDQSKAWFFLRETTTLYSSGTQGGDAESDLKTSPVTAQLFWLLLSTERAYSIRKHRPLTILVSPLSPSLEELPDELKSSGFAHLVDLYHPFDEIFFGSWNSTSTGFSIDSVLHIEAHLQKVISISLDLPEIQMADLLVSQQWLRMIMWQLATKLGFLSSTTKHESLTFWYPINIARDLMISTWGMSQQSMQIHGIGLVEKLFDICYQLIDVMIYTPSIIPERAAGELAPEEYLTYLFSLIAKLRGGDERFIPLLTAKLEHSSLSLSDPLSGPLGTPALLANSTSPPDFSQMEFEDEEIR